MLHCAENGGRSFAADSSGVPREEALRRRIEINQKKVFVPTRPD
jgi:hypothetical protein